jgi:hypothetical protein
MRNILSCFIADFEVASVLSRVLEDPSINDFTTERFKAEFSELGINSDMQNLIYSEFTDSYKTASRWRDSRTVLQMSKCIGVGVGGLDCP